MEGRDCAISDDLRDSIEREFLGSRHSCQALQRQHLLAKHWSPYRHALVGEWDGGCGRLRQWCYDVFEHMVSEEGISRYC